MVGIYLENEPSSPTHKYVAEIRSNPTFPNTNKPTLYLHVCGTLSRLNCTCASSPHVLEGFITLEGGRAGETLSRTANRQDGQEIAADTALFQLGHEQKPHLDPKITDMSITPISSPQLWVVSTNLSRYIGQ